jgi:membrane protease YdiL (CAAX protease family)
MNSGAAHGQALEHSWRGSRWLSAAEFILGAGIVIGHNVFHVVPNEVPILFGIGWISIHFRNGGWKTVGLRRPKSWKLTLIFAASAAAVRLLLGIFLVDPISARIWPPEKTSSVISRTHGDWKAMLVALLIIWTFAAFGEELGYRGYLLNRGAEVGNRSPVAYWISVLAVAVLFGYGHWYKGPAAILDSGTAGLVLGGAYLLSKRNLWVPVLAHGFVDTAVVVATFLGWAN